MHKRITFQGMTASNDILNAAEGECLEMVNLRMDGGSLRPVPKPQTVAELDSLYKLVFWHETASCYLCVTNDNKANVHFYDDKWQRLKEKGTSINLQFANLVDVRGIEFVGYIACCITGKGLFYLMGGSGTYRWLGERPPIPILRVSLKSELKSLVTPLKFTLSSKAELFEVSWRYNAHTYIDECISNLNKEGCFIDRALFKFALRLFDGSYIFCSHTVYVSDDEIVDGVGRDSFNFYFEAEESSDEMNAFKVCVKGFKPIFTLRVPGLANWKGVIVGIDIFTTGSIMGHSLETHKTKLMGSEEGQRPVATFLCYLNKSLEDIYDEILSASQYYKIAEFDIDGNCVYELKDVSRDNLQMQQSLADVPQPSSYSSIVPECSTVFNNRLHLGSLKEMFFKGYNSYSLVTANSQMLPFEGVAVETKIRTADGTSSVLQYYGMCELGFFDRQPELPALLSYPDSRAYEMTVYVTMDTELFYRTFPLTPHKSLNVAQYLHKWSYRNRITVTPKFKSGITELVKKDSLLQMRFPKVGVYELIYNADRESWIFGDQIMSAGNFAMNKMFRIPPNLADGDKIVITVEYSGTGDEFLDINNIPINYSWTLGSDFPEEVSPYELRKNVLKVSAVDNPFLFPAKCTYTPSQMDVRAMVGNAMALSQGQFGEHPLFVFCGDGIWAMSIDASGQVAYQRSNLFSRDICIGKRKVCSTVGGLVFVGEGGVMYLTSAGVNKISSVIELDERNRKIISSNNVFADILRIVLFGDVIGGMPFVDYIRSCSMAYDYFRNELLFSNPSCEYMYVFSMTNGFWSKIEIAGVAGFIDNGGNEVCMFQNCKNMTKTRILSRGNSLVGSNRVLLFTRPLLYGTKLLKRIFQFMVHVYARYQDNAVLQTPLFGCYLLCSNDGVIYNVVTGSEFYDEVNDVCFPFFPKQSYRYYMFALVGDMGEDSMISGIDVDVEAVWGNRMRR